MGRLEVEVGELLRLESGIALKDAGVDVETPLEDIVSQLDSTDSGPPPDSTKDKELYVTMRKTLSKEVGFLKVYTDTKRRWNADARRALRSHYPSYMFEHCSVIPFFNEDGSHDPLEEGKDF